MAEHGPDPDAGDATAADGPRGARSAADGDRDDHETFVRLLLEHEPRVRGFIRGLVPTWHDVDEVVQQASLVAWRKFNEFDRGTNFGSWLMVIARFEAERQALSMMDHVNIARVLDAGTTSDSARPYFVMELIASVMFLLCLELISKKLASCSF